MKLGAVSTVHHLEALTVNPSSLILSNKAPKDVEQSSQLSSRRLIGNIQMRSRFVQNHQYAEPNWNI